MHPYEKQARAFFRKGEYALFLKEAKRYRARSFKQTMKKTPYAVMLVMHVDWGLSREDMEIINGRIHIHKSGAISMARARLQQPDVSPELQDHLMDVLGELIRSEE